MADTELGEAGANRCLNCGAALHGAFCAACGQRSVPADPTVADVAGEAWHELSGYDGRIAETFRKLLRPGMLTLAYLEGRRARYLSPVRLYLTVSVLYFLVSAAAPPSTRMPDGVDGPGGLRIQLNDRQGGIEMTAEERAEMLRNIDRAPSYLRPVLRAVAEDPATFRARIFTVMPRVFFGMLPVFAAIVALFYRNRNFPTALVFAAHLHAFAYLIFTFSEAAKFAESAVFENVVRVVAMIVFAAYALTSFKRVFANPWPRTILKSAGVGALYIVAAVPAFIIILYWASVV